MVIGHHQSHQNAIRLPRPKTQTKTKKAPTTYIYVGRIRRVNKTLSRQTRGPYIYFTEKKSRNNITSSTCPKNIAEGDISPIEHSGERPTNHLLTETNPRALLPR